MDATVLALALEVFTFGLLGLRLRRVIAQSLLVNFGPSDEMILRPDERRVLFQEAARQQRLAFALLAMATTLGFVLGAFLIGRFVTATAVDTKTIAAAVTTAGDITLGVGAWRLYKATSKRLDDVTNKI